MHDLLDILDATIDDYRSDKRGPAYIPKNYDLRRMLDHMGRPGPHDYRRTTRRRQVFPDAFPEAFQTAQTGTPVCIINMDQRRDRLPEIPGGFY